jgi:hypothetical protein
VADLTEFSTITRVQPFAGLVIDPSTWGTAHDYHRLHHRLHLLSMHGSGIANGLTVAPSDPPGDAVLVEPGVAVDGAGEVIVVSERERIGVDARSGTAYIALEHVAVSPLRADGTPEEDPQEARGRVVESHRIAVLTEPPQAPALELARVTIEAGAQLAITAARDPWTPGPNEIDARYRVGGGEQSPPDVRVALVSPDAGDESVQSHLQGFAHLLRACAFAGVRATPVFAANGEVPEAELLYVTGHAEAEPWNGLVDGLRERLVGGSWVFADSCGCGAGASFVQGLEPLLEAVPGVPGEAETEALVGYARYVFGAPPPGACEGDLKWGGRAVLSARDYGCAWTGHSSDGPLPRSQIRDALEFGVNIVVSAGGYGRAR